VVSGALLRRVGCMSIDRQRLAAYKVYPSVRSAAT
jgi:hypothetical protein